MGFEMESFDSDVVLYAPPRSWRLRLPLSLRTHTPQKAEEKLLKKLMAKLQEETKPACEKTAKKELEEARRRICIYYTAFLGVKGGGGICVSSSKRGVVLCFYLYSATTACPCRCCLNWRM